MGGSQFTVAAKRIGKFKLTLRAEMDGPAKRADIVVREIEVVPNGREQTMVFNGRLDSVSSTISISHPTPSPKPALSSCGLSGSPEPGRGRHGYAPAHAVRLF